MYCTKCGVELRDEDRFCSQCGTGIGQWTTSLMAAPRSLRLDKAHKKIAGVCAGFARYFDVDVVLVRVIWVAITFFGGAGFLAYLAAWIVIPCDPVYEGHIQASQRI